jgi:ABC transporter substrate binding protein
VLWNPEALAAEANYRATQAAAESLGVQAQSWEFRSGYDAHLRLWTAFDTSQHDRAEAVIVLRDALMEIAVQNINGMAGVRGLPTMHPFRRGVEPNVGFPYPGPTLRVWNGLMCYAVNATDLARRAAAYVDKVLRGAKPADLPVEQPSTFDFVLNLETARNIGFTFPASILAQATEVIR